MSGWDEFLKDRNKDQQGAQTSTANTQSGSSGWDAFLKDRETTQNTDALAASAQKDTAEPAAVTTPTEDPFQLRMAKASAAGRSLAKSEETPKSLSGEQQEIAKRVQEMIGGLAKSAGGSVKDRRQAQTDFDAAYKEMQASGLGSEGWYAKTKKDADRLAKDSRAAARAAKAAEYLLGGTVTLEGAEGYDAALAAERTRQRDEAKQKAEETAAAYEAAVQRADWAELTRWEDAKNSESYGRLSEIGAADSRNKVRRAEKELGNEFYNPEKSDVDPDELRAAEFMTADEKQLYDYLLADRGEEAADRYLAGLQGTLNIRQGKQIADEIEDSAPVGRAVNTIALAGATGVGNALKGLTQNLRSEAAPASATDYAGQYVAEGLEDIGPKIGGHSVARIGYDALNTMANMAPSLAVGAINPIAGAATMGLSSKGNAYKRALDEGYTKGEAQVYSSVIGAAEGGLQYLLGGFSKLGGVGQFTEAFTKNVGKAGLRAAGELGIDILGENLEEYLQNKLDLYMRNTVFGENNEIKLWDEEDTYTILLTTLTTGLLNAGQTHNTAQVGKVGRSFYQSRNVDTLLGLAAQSGNRDVRTLAEDIVSGKTKATENSIGELAIAYAQAGGDLSAIAANHATVDTEASEAAARSRVTPTAEIDAQDAAETREAEGGIITPAESQTQATDESERLNRDTVEQGAGTVAEQEKTALDGTGNAPDTAAVQRAPAEDFTPKPTTKWNPKSKRGQAEKKAARKLNRESGLWSDTQAAAEAVHRVAESMRDRSRGTDVMEVARQAADEMLQRQKSGLESGDRDLYNKVRDFLRGTDIHISDELRGDIPDFSAWKKDAMRKLRLRVNSGRAIDSIYAELGQIAGEGMFPPDITAHSDQIAHILHLMELLKPQALMMSETFTGEGYNSIRDAAAEDLARAAAETVGGKWTGYELGSSLGNKSEAAKRYDAIQQEIEVAAWDGEMLSQEDAARLVDERFMQYGVYDLSELMNETNETEDFDNGTDETGEEAEALPGDDAAETERDADAGAAEDGGAGIQPVAERNVPAERQAGGVTEQDERLGGKRSQTESNTLQGVAEKLGGEQEELYYLPITERQTLTEAVNRVMADAVGEMNTLADKELWTAADIDTAMTIYGKLQADAVRSGDYAAAQAMGRLIQERGTKSGQALQAFSKWTRSGAGQAAQAQQTLDQAAQDGKISREEAGRIANDVFNFAQEYDNIADGDRESLRALIKRLSDYRRTGTFFKGNFEKLLNKIHDFDYLKEYAMRQMMAVTNDAMDTADLGQKLKTWQVNAQLIRLPTFFRNIGGNQIFGTLDALAQDSLGLALDHLAGAFSGKREVGFNKGWFSSRARKAAMDAMNRSALEVAGDVNMSGDASKYGTTANRTFKMSGNAFERFVSRWEQLLGYSLQTSDAMFRGKIEEANREGLENIRNNAPDAESREAIAEATADYELFQNKGTAYGVSKGLHDILNLAGIGGTVDKKHVSHGRQGGFGFGDFVNPYPGVPANLAVKALEFSPANLARGAVEFANVMKSIKMGTYEAGAQNKAVMDMARGLAGMPIIAIMTAMFKSGLVRNWGDEDDLDAAAQNRAEGKTGVQINLDALIRGANGDDTEWRDGDAVMSVSWLEPLNAFMAIASLAAQDDSGDRTLESYAKHSFNGALQAALEMPVMQNIANVVDTMKYSTAESTGEKAGEAALGLMGDALTGMIPAPFGQLARTLDENYRDVSADSSAGQVWNNVRNIVPGLRETLPEKMDNFGQPKQYTDSEALRFLNNFVLPGAVNQIRQSDVSAAVEELYKSTGDANVYPDRKAPSSVKAGDVNHRLNAEEKRAYQGTYGNIVTEYTDRLLNSGDYDILSDEEKSALIVKIKQYASAVAKHEMFDLLELPYSNKTWDKKIEAVENGEDLLELLIG